MRSLLAIFVLGGLVMIFIFPGFLKTFDNLKSDIESHGPEKRVMENTREVNGTVISSEDNSYKKEKSTFLLIGGGEEKIERYIIKIKEKDGSIISVKANEDQFLRYSKKNSIKVIVDKESSEIKYDMRSDKDKEEYNELKKTANS